MAKNCVPLKGSKACPAFSGASISTDDNMVAMLYVFLSMGKLFLGLVPIANARKSSFSSPFLSYVSNTKDFDEKISSYVKNDYVKLKYVIIINIIISVLR